MEFAGPVIHTAKLAVEEAAEIELVVRARSPSTDWSKLGSESAAINVHLDSAHKHDIVLFMGDRPFNYKSVIGWLEPGTYEIELAFSPDLSSSEARSPEIEDVRFESRQPGDPDFLAHHHSPFIFGRPVCYRSDVPLLLGYERARDENGHHVLRYVAIFSNEDGGTNTQGLMARWGRTTDIEWVYSVTVAEDGTVLAEQYHSGMHETSPFRGSHEGGHPILTVANRHHTFAQTGWGAYRFCLVPATEIPRGNPLLASETVPREWLMDAHPWTYRIAGQELERERKVQAEISEDLSVVFDLRQYVYVGFRCGAPAEQCDQFHGYPVHRSAELEIAVRIEGHEDWFSSDPQGLTGGIRKMGWARVAVKVPPGARPEDLVELRFTAKPDAGGGEFEMTVEEIDPVFVLQAGYQPCPTLLAWQGEAKLTKENPQAAFALR